MEIQLEEWDKWRIAGTELDWQFQVLVKDKKSLLGTKWVGRAFFSTLGAALDYAYEKTLRESKENATSMKRAVAECKRVKEALKEAVDAAR